MNQTATERPRSKDGSLWVTDEVYNTWISGTGALLAAIGAALLIYKAAMTGRPGSVLGFSVYGLGLIGMFLSSALHHGIDGSPETNHFFRQLDYFAIFFLIAATFTPFCLILLRNHFGWIVLALFWALAVAGILLKAFYPRLPAWIMVGLCVAMGWLGLLILKPLYQAIHLSGLLVLVLGGLFFSGGGVIYALEKPNPFPGKFGFHEIWHCFVFAGAAAHFFVMYVWLA